MTHHVPHRLFADLVSSEQHHATVFKFPENLLRKNKRRCWNRNCQFSNLRLASHFLRYLEGLSERGVQKRARRPHDARLLPCAFHLRDHLRFADKQ